jgi:peptidylprolyl isomerase
LRLAVGFKHPDGKTYSYANSDFFSILPMRGIWGGDLAGGKCILLSLMVAVSIYGTRFVDETYAISHNREGLLTTANFNGPNANDSRFIITMGPAQWLDRRSVAFGEVIHGLEILRQIELYGNA